LFGLAILVAAVAVLGVAVVADFAGRFVDLAVAALRQGAILVAVAGLAAVVALLRLLQLAIDEAVAARLVGGAGGVAAVAVLDVAVVADFTCSVVDLTVAAAARGHADGRVLLGRTDGAWRAEAVVAAADGARVQAAGRRDESERGEEREGPQ